MKKIITIFLSIMIVGLLGLFLFLQYKQQNVGPVFEYDKKRDRNDIIALFKDNWHWLIASDDFSTEFMLDYNSPNRNPRYLGSMRFHVVRQDNKAIGFVGYYMKQKDLGWLLFLVVDEKYRRHGYAEMLVKTAMRELQKMGAKKIRLLTLSVNYRAQALYRKLGFEEYKYDPRGSVYFEYSV